MESGESENIGGEVGGEGSSDEGGEGVFGTDGGFKKFEMIWEALGSREDCRGDGGGEGTGSMSGDCGKSGASSGRGGEGWEK